MIEGKMVKLRALEQGDLERAYEWANDREVTRYLMIRYPMSRSDEEKWLSESSGKNGFEHGVSLAIETKDGTHIGVTGLHRASPEDRCAELGIMIGDKSFWSNGYGTDTIVTLLRFAFYEMNLHRVGLGVFPFNERGMTCYLKCGFIEEGRNRENIYKDGRYWDVIRMGILRDEFDELHGAAQAETAAATG